MKQELQTSGFAIETGKIVDLGDMKIIVSALICLACGIGLYFYFGRQKLYRPHENGKFQIHSGETFIFALNENGSTGCTKCWINESSCHSVKLVNEKYESSWAEKTGSVGVGGTVSWKFIGTTKGTDTIKISECPTGIMQKSCAFFSEDSMKLISDSAYKVKYGYFPMRKPDNIFIVNVTE